MEEITPIAILLAVVGLVIWRLPKIDLGHSAEYRKRRVWNWLPLGLTYSFLYMGRYNLKVAEHALGLPSDLDPARVINIGSIDGLQVPALETYAYSASKAACHHLSRVLAKKLAPKRITVNAVAPGPFESKMMAATLERFGDAIAAGCPLGRIGTPEDMAGVAIYLASRAGAYVTGAVIPVDGGIWATA